MLTHCYQWSSNCHPVEVFAFLFISLCFIWSSCSSCLYWNFLFLPMISIVKTTSRFRVPWLWWPLSGLLSLLPQVESQRLSLTLCLVRSGCAPRCYQWSSNFVILCFLPQESFLLLWISCDFYDMVPKSFSIPCPCTSKYLAHIAWFLLWHRLFDTLMNPFCFTQTPH